MTVFTLFCTNVFIFVFALSKVNGQFTGECQHVLTVTNESQTISSPGYPASYSNYLDCRWFLEASVGYHIVLVFQDFSTEKSFDYVTVNTGNDERIVLSGRELYKKTFYSTSTTLVLTFVTDGSKTETGFLATYREIDEIPQTDPGGACGTGLRTNATDIPQVLSSPGFPQPYENKLNCRWELSARNNNHVALTFHQFRTEERVDLVTIQGEVSLDEIYLSGNEERERTFYSKDNTLVVLFRSDETKAYIGFNATFREIDVIPDITTEDDCKFILQATNESQVISSPRFPDEYENNLECEWKLLARNGYQISLTFRHFHTEERLDKVTIQRGDGHDELLSGEEGSGRRFYSRNGTLLVLFQTDGSVIFTGFNATFVEITAVPNVTVTENTRCGSVLAATNESKTLSSPSYPAPYQDMLECHWLLSARNGFQILLVFHDFETEFNYDFVRINDGDIVLAVLSGGEGRGRTFYSSNGALVIRFVSDQSNARRGFNATFTETDQVPSITLPTTRECGGTNLSATNESQVITSPGYPLPYRDGLVCQWILVARSSGFQVVLTFEDFTIENSYDKVYIRDGNDVLDELSGIQGRNRTFYSSNGTLVVRFTTDSSNSERGFNATFVDSNVIPNYTLIRSRVCGVSSLSAMNESQVITSPGYPLSYRNDLYCRWTLTAHPGLQVMFTIEHFTTESRYDVLFVDDGSNIVSILSGVIRSGTSFISSNEVLILTFSTDGSATLEGFSAFFIEVNTTAIAEESSCTIIERNCGFDAVATNENQIISSPHFPSSYENGLACRWNLEARDGRQVVLVLTEFDIQQKFDYVCVNDGVNPPSRLTGVVESGRTFISLQGNLTLVFSTDYYISGKGFIGVFVETTSGYYGLEGSRGGCGFNATATREPRSISSPGWPATYSDDVVCLWLLNSRPDYFIRLIFQVFDTESNYDILYVRDGDNPEVKFSGSFNGSEIFARSGRLTLLFITDRSVTLKGFTATFEETDDAPKEITSVPDEFKIGDYGFYMNATRNVGFLYSPNWPNVYPNSLTAEWIILTHSVGFQINFTLVSLETESCCDSLTILDDSLVIAELRGRSMAASSYFSNFGYLRIWFRSDSSVADFGFRALYMEIPEGQVPQRDFEMLAGNTSKNTQLPNKRYFCGNGKSIPIENFCDGEVDCEDRSDENNTTPPYTEWQFDLMGCHVSLHNKTCMVHREYICNDTIKCFDVNYCDAGCTSHYRCKNQSCLPLSSLCNANTLDGCLEDQEWTNGPGFKCNREGQTCFLPQQLIHDGVKDCDDAADICFSINKYNNNNVYNRFRLLPPFPLQINHSHCFQCLDLSMIIPIKRVCDGVLDCSDLSDECLCEGTLLKVCERVQMRRKIPARTNMTCLTGQVICEDNQCIDRVQICNTITDCNNNWDEKYDFCHGTLQCSHGQIENAGEECRCQSHFQAKPGILCDGNADCSVPYPGQMWEKLPGFPDDECVASCPNISSKFRCGNKATATTEGSKNERQIPCAITVKRPPGIPKEYPPPTMPTTLDSTKICDGVIDCTFDFTDETSCPDRFYCIAGNLISISRQKVCDGFENCDDKSDENNSTLCEDRFYCPALAGEKVSMKREFYCDFNINCDDQTDESNCNKKDRFYCENKQPLFVTLNKMFDGHSDCTDSSDECPTTDELKHDNVFSSRYHVIANPILRAFVWIMGILAVVGNLVVIYTESRNVGSAFRNLSSATLRTNRILVLNLAVADFLMGVYLIMFGIVGVMYSGRFCAHRLRWLSSNTCSAMGVMVVLSSETSVITLVLLTSARLFAVIKPASARSKPTTTFVFFCVLWTWGISLFLAFLPLTPSLQYIFAEQAFLNEKLFFKSTVVSFASAKKWLESFLTYDIHFVNSSSSVFDEITDAHSWFTLRDIIESSPSASYYFNPTRFLGYYSANSACIPRLYVTKADSSWVFSIFLTIFNFVSFMYVACAYAFIVMRSRRSPSGSRSTSNALTSMQKKILRLILTDFCCWIPITIIAFLSIAGVSVSNTAYAVSAIILLPINSALNPILYSNAIDILIEKIKLREMPERLRKASQSAVEFVTGTVQTTTV